MTTVKRIDTNARMSRVVIYDNTVLVGGLTANDGTLDIKGQTQQVLDKIEGYLQKAGTDKDHVVSAQIWLKDIARDFEGMNEVWDAWFASGKAPVRATGQSALAKSDHLVEIIMTAVMP